MAGTPRSYYVNRLEGGEPLCGNRVDIRPTRETFQNFQPQPAINEEEEEVISARPEGKNSGVGNNDMCGNNIDDQNDIELPVNHPPELPSLPAPGESAVRRSIRVRKETQFYKP